MRSFSIITIMAIAAFAGNMINIGLSYSIHWLSRLSVAFMKPFTTGFPLLLGPTGATLLSSFLGTIFLY